MTMVHKRTGRTGTSPDAAAGPATASGGGRSAAEFTATVERHMHARGMSVRATARAAGYSDHTLVSKVLNGHKPVTHYLAMKLDRALSANGENADRAVTEAQEAIALGSAAPAGERHLYAELLVRTDQAVAHLRQPDLDGAATALRPVLDLPPGMRTEPLLQQLHQVRRMLALPSFADTASAVSLQGEIEIYDYEALPRQIAG